MSFTQRQLQIFIHAATTCNFRQTADQLGISQPSVSEHIHAMEAHLRLSLFLRDRGRPVRLSQAGKDLLDQARDVNSRLRELNAYGRGENEITLRASIGNYLFEHKIRPRLPAFYAERPNVHIRFMPVAEPDEAYRWAEEGSVDLFAATLPRTWIDECAEVLLQVDMALCATPELAATIHSHADLASKRLLCFATGKGFESMFEIEQGRNLAFADIFEAPYLELLFEMALGGQGVLFFSWPEMKPLVEEGRLVRLPFAVAPCYRILRIGEKARQNNAKPAVDFLRDCLRQF